MGKEKKRNDTLCSLFQGVMDSISSSWEHSFKETDVLEKKEKSDVLEKKEKRNVGAATAV